MIVHYVGDSFTIWVTGTSTPCISTFKPIWFEALPSLDLRQLTGPLPTGTYDSSSLWFLFFCIVVIFRWSHELLYRRIVQKYKKWWKKFYVERDALESQFLAHVAENPHNHSQKELVLFLFRSYHRLKSALGMLGKWKRGG